MKIFAFGTNYTPELWWYITLLSGFTILYILSLSNWFKRVCLAFSLPGPPALPLIGNCLCATDTEALVNLGNTAYEKYGSVFRIWIATIPMYVVLEPKDLQNILGTNKNTEKTFLYDLMHNFLGNGLVTSSGIKWRTHRKILQPSFNNNILETYIDTFAESSARLVEKFKNVLSEDINITTFINNSVLEILNESILGISIKSNGNGKSSPFRSGKVLTQDRIVRPWLLFDCIYNLTTSAKNENCQRQNLNTFCKMIIQKRKEERRKGIYKRDSTSLLERMLDLKDEHLDFTYNDIANEVSTFMLAGQESVASTVSFCLYFLAKYKDIQERVFEELEAIFGDSVRIPNATDLNNMKYLEQCIKETLRLYPSVPIMARKLGENVKIGKYILPRGSDVIISPYATQRLQHFYPKPEVFNPDRFAPEDMEKRHTFSFIPFSAGPRNCIGSKFAMLEMKTLISTVVRNYEINVKAGYELKLGFRITLRAKGGIWLRFEPRVLK